MIREVARYHISHDYILNPLKFGNIIFFQIARRFCQPNTGINPHAHGNWFELTIITAGEGTIITNGEECPVKTNDIYLSFPFEIHEIQADKDIDLEYDCLSFFCEGPPFGEYFNKLTISNRSGTTRTFRDERIYSLIAHAINEFSVQNPFTEEIISSILTQVLAYTIRAFEGNNNENLDVSEAKILCFQLMNYIDTHIYSLNNLTELSKKFKYNYSYLSSLFKKTTNKTLTEYMRNRKLEIAKILIIENNKKIGEVAEMLNYSTTFAFSKAFKLKYGVSPSKVKTI